MSNKIFKGIDSILIKKIKIIEAIVTSNVYENEKFSFIKPNLL